jgi:hypothetical protein
VTEDGGANDTYTLDFDLNSQNVDNTSQTDSITLVFNFLLVQDGQTTQTDCTP